MARNVGKKPRGAQPRATGGGGGGKRWPFFVGGLLLGLLLATGIYLLKLLPTAMDLREHEAACTDDGVKEGNAANTAPGEEKKPVTFDFYNMLPDQKVVPPVNGTRTTTAVPPPAPVVPPVAPITPVPAAPAPVVAVPAATAPATPSAPAATAPRSEPAAAKPAGRFSLQAGSFATRAEADRRRGELLLSGQNVSVQQARTDKGETRFRVMVGPFTDEAAMQKARQQLAGMKVDTMPVRAK